MKHKSKPCTSQKQVMDQVVRVLHSEKLRFTFDNKMQSALVPMSGDIQPYTIIITVAGNVLVFIIPYYLTLPADLEPERLAALNEKMLSINDEIGLLKFSLNKKRSEVTLSVELPWKFTVLNAKAITSFMRLINTTASTRQREFVSAAIPKPTRSRPEQVAHS